MQARFRPDCENTPFMARHSGSISLIYCREEHTESDSKYSPPGDGVVCAGNIGKDDAGPHDPVVTEEQLKNGSRFGPNKGRHSESDGICMKQTPEVALTGTYTPVPLP